MAELINSSESSQRVGQGSARDSMAPALRRSSRCLMTWGAITASAMIRPSTST
jgi:hypothetical protein